MTTETGPLAITFVRTKADKKAFFGMTRGLYADDPNFIQPLTFERLEHLDPGKNPALLNMETGLWMVYRGPKIVGRICAQVNQAHLDQHEDATAQFGFFESVDDREVIELLLDTVEIWARARGMVRIQGPFSLSINDESGLLTEGFETPPYVMMPHGKPYYTKCLEAFGYQKAKDLVAYEVDAQSSWSPAAERLIKRLSSTKGLKIRPLDMSRYDEEIMLICEIFNDAWADNWNFIPFSPEAAKHLGRNIKPLVNAECFSIAELDGRPVAMAVSLPDINDAIKDLDGRLFPFGFLKLLWRLKISGIRRWRIPLVGVNRELHGSVKGAAAVFGVIHAIRNYHAKCGVLHGELSWLLEDNVAIRRIVELSGGVHYKTFRVFERDLD